MKLVWYNKKWVVVLLHFVCWITIFALPFFLVRNSNEQQHKPPPEIGFLYFYLVTRIFWVGFFYFHAHYLFPKFINGKKYWLYILSQVVFIFVISLLHWAVFNIFVKRSSYDIAGFFVFNTFTYLFIAAASIAYRLVLDRIATEKFLRERENENLKTELSFLRSQVSPHFMFNVLNNMVALARKQSDQLEPSLIKLSSLMRYMLYEADEEKVPLEKEVDYLQSYIDLQQQRFGKKLKVNVTVEGFDTAYEIEPMLLIPFVENAFKHGTGMIDDAQIDIELRVKNSILNFSVRNKYNCESIEIKDKTSGIGLTNVTRRLNLLYGKDHTLLVTNKDNWFNISLQINLH